MTRSGGERVRTEIQFEVGKGKTDTEVFHVVLDGAEVDSGVDGPAPDPDFTMILVPDELAAVGAGDLALDVGYMQGRVKVTGNVGRMLSVLPVLTSEALVKELAARSR